MLETVREYARELLLCRGEPDERRAVGILPDDFSREGAAGVGKLSADRELLPGFHEAAPDLVASFRP